MGDNQGHKRTTKIYPYKECVDDLINEQLPVDVASTINYSRGMYGNFLSLRRTLEKAKCFQSKYRFEELDKEMHSRELFEAFLRQDYFIYCNDGVKEDEIKHEDEEEGRVLQEINAELREKTSNTEDEYDSDDDWRDGLDEWQQRAYIRSANNYHYDRDEQLLKQCAQENVPYYQFFFGLVKQFAKELVSAELKKEVEEITIKKLFRTVVERKEKLKLNVSPTEFLNKLVDAIFKGDVLKDVQWWNGSIQFEGLYVAFAVDSKKSNDEDDVTFGDDEIGHVNYSYESVDDYFKYALTKRNDCYIYSNKEENYLKRIDGNPIEIKTNKPNPKIRIFDVVLVTK